MYIHRAYAIDHDSRFCLPHHAFSPLFAHSLKLQAVPHTLPHALLKLWRIVSPQTRGLDVSRRLVVGAGQHGYDGEKNGFGCLDGRPALGGGFIAIFVFFWRVEDGDAHVAVRVDCSGLVGGCRGEGVWDRRTVGVEDGCLEAHLGWQEGVFAGKGKTGAEEASYVAR
jgi:hypothetical protein